MKQFLLIVFFSGSFLGNGQNIKTKIQESGFEIKPEAQKVEQFEEARIFVYGGAGLGVRLGEITTGFLVGAAASQFGDPNLRTQTTNESSPFKSGFLTELGFRYYFGGNFGIGAKGSLFINSAEFINLSDTYRQESKANTKIYNGQVEGLYRFYLSQSAKSIFVYSGLGLGVSIIDQGQTYSVGRNTSVNEAFFAIRPFAGIQIPVWDILHVYAETGYNYSQGKISAGTLSLSQYLVTAGIQIRLNEF